MTSRVQPSLLVAFWVLLMALLALLYTTVPPSPDQSQFDWMAYIATQGHPFYVGSFDMNWPGAMWLHEAGIRLFGVHAWTWRLTDFLLMLGFSFGGAVFLHRANWPLAAWVFVFLYPALYVPAGSWMAGQRDIIATGFLICACALAMQNAPKEGRSVVLAGVCVACAVLIRPTFLSFLAGLMFLECMPMRDIHPRTCSRSARALRFLAGFTLMIGAAICAGLALGSLDDWYRQSFQFATSIYIGEPPQDWRVTLWTLFVVSWNWITLMALFGLVVWALRDRLSYPLMLVLGIAATSTLSFAVQNKGFGYHLGGILLVLVLLLTIGIDQLDHWRRSVRTSLMRWGVTVALTGAVFLVLAGTAVKLENLKSGAVRILAGQFGPTDLYGLTEAERRDIISLIKDGSTPDQTVAVYGTHYDLPYRAQRLPTYRYFTPAADQIKPGFVHYDEWMAEVDQALVQTPPAFVVMTRRALPGPPDELNPALADRSILTRLQQTLSEDYKVVFSNANVVVYQSPR
ncbi:glycosyltransferase family 87 protein [Primorskyibacter flagellatus]|uniref:Glycosyltransferase RgtA/B/C/D-like domain-containing protein n=1 Tax=Primorskyibacter flagellatus TaxID=1387277 RepID=A0A1W2E0M5_9RHOB|nr:glycosyltransferase family 87 protein [Primorskyibacter flagellatus]SMD03283.1 hypothetical protein SAMN06295998_12044 [Primorskyibacter flagellatus]